MIPSLTCETCIYADWIINMGSSGHMLLSKVIKEFKWTRDEIMKNHYFDSGYCVCVPNYGHHKIEIIKFASAVDKYLDSYKEHDVGLIYKWSMACDKHKDVREVAK